MPKPSYKFVIGQRIGTWTIKSCAGTVKGVCGGRMRWICVCDCGKERAIPAGDLQRKTTSSCSRCRAWLVKHDAALNEIIRSYKMGAVSRSLEWSITKAHVKALLESRCFYCDACPESVRHYGPENSLLYKHGGIDRINSFIGYTIENTVACCTKCNYAKNDMNITDFSQWVYTVYTHMKNAKWGDNFVR